jgi:hypothetical protein
MPRIRSWGNTGATFQRMARPVRKWLPHDDLTSLHQRIPVSGRLPGQDRDPRVNFRRVRHRAKATREADFSLTFYAAGMPSGVRHQSNSGGCYAPDRPDFCTLDVRSGVACGSACGSQPLNSGRVDARTSPVSEPALSLQPRRSYSGAPSSSPHQSGDDADNG